MGCIVIDDNVINDIRLNSTDKIIYGTIKALSNKTGYCYGTNDYIGKKLNLSKSTISNTICKLKKINYIRIRTEDYRRKIYLNKIINENETLS